MTRESALAKGTARPEIGGGAGQGERIHAANRDIIGGTAR